jgi:heme/copper-type cytochrome/quinol oxidase subunit 4
MSVFVWTVDDIVFACIVVPVLIVAGLYWLATKMEERESSNR